MLQDLRYAIRRLLKTPAFAAVIVVTLALGIGANAAIFSFFRGILLRPLPYRDPERIVLVKKQARDFGEPNGISVGLLAADFRDLRTQTATLADTATYTLDSATLTGRGPADIAVVTIVTPNYFSLLGAQALLGRTFAADEMGHAPGRLATLSYHYWKTRLGGDPEIVGQTLVLNNVPFTVVGVMPADFDFPRETHLWATPAGDVPESVIGQPARDYAGRGNEIRTILGRIRTGVTRVQAEAELAALVARLPNPNALQRSVHLVDFREQSVGNVRPALAILLACVGLVLLIACLNVANLMLSRATGRQREVAVRLALGATGWQITRFLLAESLALAAAGGIAGVALSHWGLALLVSLAPADIPRLDAVQLDGWVLGFAALISLLAGLASGLVPALGIGRPDLTTATRSGGRGVSANPRSRRLRAILISGEVAISLVLLVAAGLLVRSLGRMQDFAWGFKPGCIVSARVAFLSERYREPAARARFARELLSRLEASPGIESVGTCLDRIGHSWVQFPFTPDGHTYPTPGDRPQGNFHIVSPGYLRTLGIPLLQGRDFTENDDASAPLTVIIDAAMSRRYFPDGNAVGRRLRIPTYGGEADSLIVGIAGEVKSDGPTGQSRPDFYVPFLQILPDSFFVHVRTSLGSAAVETAIRQIVATIDPDIPISDLSTMDQIVAGPTSSRRFPLGLLTAFAALALLLATVGIYAVTAYSVSQRTREIGVRLALGASPRSILGLVVREGFRPIGAGFAIGLAAAAATALAMRSLLFGVNPIDAYTFTVVPVLLGAVAALACWVPARRATRVDPMVALRAE